MSGLVDENDRCVFGEYPGKLKDVLGIWVEEVDALRPDEKNVMKMNGEMPLSSEEYSCGFLCDLLHTREAKALAVYGDDFYAGMPCLTKNTYGEGVAYYIGTEPSDEFLADFTAAICKERGIEPVYEAANTPLRQEKQQTEPPSVPAAISSPASSQMPPLPFKLSFCNQHNCSAFFCFRSPKRERLLHNPPVLFSFVKALMKSVNTLPLNRR